MRFPFFKPTAKVETKDTIKVPTSPTPTGKKLAATQRLSVPQLVTGRFNKPATPAVTTAPAPIAGGPTVALRLNSISPQIPAQIYSVQGQATAATAKIAVPVSVILPQLATGKVSIKLGQLLTYFPPALLRSPLPPYPEQQPVVLPLEEIIPAIPSDLLNVTHESELRVNENDPDLQNVPNLIDEESLAAHRRQQTAALAETQAVRCINDDPFRGIKNDPKPLPPSAPPAPVKPVTSSRPASDLVIPPRPRNDAPESIVISLAAIVEALPDAVFNCPRSEAATKASTKEAVLLPADPIIPQLRTGVVRLPVSVIVSLLPHNILAHPMPNLDGLTAALPLAEIIPQLPPSVFTDHLRAPAADNAAVDLDIPDPFQEKNAAPALPATPEPTPTAAIEEEVLADDNFAIFAEKSAPAPMINAPEPVAKIAPVETKVPAVESVVERQPVEPVAPPPVPEPEPVPVTRPEPVADVAPVEPAYADADTDGDLTDDEAGLPPLAAPQDVTESFDERKVLVDLNRCTAEDLMTIPGVGRALAHRIIEFRSVRGRFTSIEELRQVPGIGRKTYRALAGVQARALNRLLGADHDGELTLQEIVRLTAKLPGIQGCMLALNEGLFLTGQLPPHLDQNTISVFAPQLFKKVGRYARELKVGSIRRFTIFTDTQPLSIFKAGDVYLVIVHDVQRFSKALLRRCERISEEIARLSSQRVTV
jgi:competence ComEA-like helix-hairpin-helix protein